MCYAERVRENIHHHDFLIKCKRHAQKFCLVRDAPIGVLDLKPFEDAKLLIADNRGQDYVAPPPGPTPAFSGTGNRLGAPTPEPSTGTASAAPQASSSGDSGDRPSVQTKLEVDRTQPVAQIRLRLPNNPRYPVTLNLTHTVGDLRNLINAYVTTKFILHLIINVDFCLLNFTERALVIQQGRTISSQRTNRLVF